MKSRKTTAPLRGFVYSGNGAMITADVDRRQRKGVPRVDTIRLKLTKSRKPEHNMSIYMRPDEAVAVASCLAAAAWNANLRKPRRR